MGDKISALPAATSVDGTEIIPIVQGGATKKVTGTILRSPTGVAGGDLTGTYPNPTLASITTAQTAVGSGTAIPVLTTDAKGRVVSLTTVVNPALTTAQIAGLSTNAAAALATAGVAGLSTFAARADHQHARPTPAEIGALAATATAGGDLAGNYPAPSLAAITTAQVSVGSTSQIPVLSIDNKGRVTALTSVPITSSAGGTVKSITAGTGLAGGVITDTGTIDIAAVTTAQANVGSSSVVPVISINDQGQVVSLTTAQITSGALTTTAPSPLAGTATAGLSTEAARADHQHVFPTATQIGALAATATASGDLIGNYPGPTLAAITTAQSNVGSSSVIPVISIDAKGRVTSLSTANAASAITAFRNRIINGDMIIDQRNNGTASASSINGYFLDRWVINQSPTTGKLIAQQNAGSITAPVGFSKYLGITSQGAYNIGSNDYYLINQPIEGQNIRDFGWGTANASTVTLSFIVYSSLTGTFGGCIGNGAGTRSYPFNYSIPTANTWTTISITIPGDTTGTWVTTNGVGIYIYFGIGVGSVYCGTAGSWTSQFKFSATGSVSVVGTSGATFYITGIQFERGGSASVFETLPYSTQLVLCQRYYDTTTMWVPATGDPRQVFYKSSMRAAPTIAGGGTGFAATNQTVNGASVVQTTAGNQSLTFSSEL